MAANESKVIFAAGQELVLYDLQTRQNESLVSTGQVSGNQNIYTLSENIRKETILFKMAHFYPYDQIIDPFQIFLSKKRL